MTERKVSSERVSEERLRENPITKQYLEGLWQELVAETGEFLIGKQTLFLIVDLALASLDTQETATHPHLWGVQYSDNNRVDANNVFRTEGAAMARAMEAAIPAKVVPLYIRPSPAALKGDRP